MSSYEYSDGGDRGGGTRGAGAVFSSSGSEADDPLGPEAEEEEYVLDTFVDDDSSALAVDHMIGQYRSFVEDYNRSIVAVEEAIDESFSDLWDATHDPITLRVEPFEQATLLQLARSESLHFNKICAVLGYICEEIDHLVVEGHAVQFPRLALFGSFLTGDDAEDDGEIQKNMGRLIEPLQDTVVWTQRCYTVLYNAMHQLACLYSKRQALFDVRGVHLTAVFEKVGALLAALVTLQEIFWQNPVLGEAWQLYRRMIQNMRNAPALYETTLEGLRQVEGVLDEIEGALFTDRIYESAIDQPFDADLRNVTGNRWLKDEMMYALANMQAFLASRIGQASETDQRERFVDFCALYGLYFALYQDTSEKKFFRSVWDMYKLVPIVHLFGPVYWFPNYFLTRTLPAMRKFAKKGDVDGARAKFLARLDEQLPSIVQGFTLQVSAWMARMESNLSKAATTGQILNNRMALFTQGVVLAYNIGHMFKSAMGLHISLEVILTDHHIVPLCHLVELSKAIEATYHRRSVLVGENVAHMVQQISIGLQRSLLPIKTKIEGARNPDNKALDTLAGVDMAMELLYGPASKGRQRMLPLAMSVVYSLGLITPKNQGEFEAQVRRLHLVANIQEHIRTACNFNHLFWGRQMLGVYFKHVYRSSSAHDLAYLLAGFRDAYSMLKTVQHEDEVVQLHMALEAEVEDRLEDCVIAPLGHDVEKDLRKNIKVNDLQRKPNPFVEHIHDVAPFFAIAPLILFEKHVDIKARVEHFLDQRFYNLTSLHQNDWRVYEEMRNLARQKFGLSLIDVHLPGQTHQEDLDCLVIMRKIDYFVANYCYNLQSQFFIERATSSRTLNSISIEHIATSIRMHGTGVMNTAVNYVYGYLESRLASVSKFLFDDHIRSPLMADVRWYREHRLEVDNVYPFDRAERFNRDIRRLGVVGNLTALDRFRVLITEIGNALGFIRMIRSGGLHHCAEAIKFIPDITNIVSFKALAERDGLSAEVVASAENLDNHIASLSSSFAEGTEYFQLLVDVFKTTMRGTANAHMETFHAVIPALTINYIEYIIESKDTVLKRNKEGASFTDDGFMVGCAYVLKVLGQTKNFASLHWFDSVTRRYAEQQLKVKAEHDALSRRERKRQRETAKLTLNRLARFATEFETLYFSFDGALIFFRD